MKTLVLSDIHANAAALKAVLQVALPCDRILFLGDLANFGPCPAECVEILKERNPICIMGNHDAQIVSEHPENFWDVWAKRQLSDEQQAWMRSFKESIILDGHILLVHGVYSVKYDIFPNTPDEEIRNAFQHLLTPDIDQVWFGHYHYQVDRVIDGVEYHCIRPVGHHRDGDTRASYSMYENGCLIHKRVDYPVEETMEALRVSNPMELFIEMLRDASHSELLLKDSKQIEENEKRKAE